MDELTRREFLAGSAILMAGPGMQELPVLRGAGARNLLSSAYPPAQVASILMPREKWRPFPMPGPGSAWESIPAADRASLVSAGERFLKADWPALPAALFLEYARIGNRSNYEAVRSRRRDRLRELVIAECAEGKGRFVDDIVNGIWATCEESYWGVPAHLNLQKAGPGLPDVAEPTVDLFTGETASLLAWTLYLTGPKLDKVSPLIRERIHLEVDRRVLTPNLARNFGWMGFSERPDRPARAPNNWNPWINSNWLTAALLLERDEKRRVASVNKILLSLDQFLDGYADDGGCDEGPGYWFRAGGSLFDCLELLLSATAGALDLYQVPLVGEIGRYIYRAHIYDRYFINFADASAVLGISGNLLFRYGRRIGDPKLSALGAFAAARSGTESARSDSIGRQLPAIFTLGEMRAAEGYQPLVRDAWFPGIQVMAARRKEKSAEGLYLAAQGGHNAESHNHNDVGNFIVYADGKPVIIDVGVETYSAKTFSSKRYEIWTMQSAYHNLPTIDGIMQKDGLEFAASDVAYHADDDAAEFSLNIATAYPAEAGLKFWKRTLRFDRANNQIELRDEYSLKKRVSQIAFTFMTPLTVNLGVPGELRFGDSPFPSGSVKLFYDARSLAPVAEEIPLKDSRLRSAWGEKLYRIILKAQDPPESGVWSFRIQQKGS
jgi:hypothetical protein